MKIIRQKAFSYYALEGNDREDKHIQDKRYRVDEIRLKAARENRMADYDYIDNRLDEGLKKSKKDREEKLEKSRDKGLAIGALTGIGAGLVANKLLKKKKPGISALGGLALGGLAGSLAGDIYTRKKYKGYLKHQYDAMDDVIEYDKHSRAKNKNKEE